MNERKVAFNKALANLTEDEVMSLATGLASEYESFAQPYIVHVFVTIHKAAQELTQEPTNEQH